MSIPEKVSLRTQYLNGNNNQATLMVNTNADSVPLVVLLRDDPSRWDETQNRTLNEILVSNQLVF